MSDVSLPALIALLGSMLILAFGLSFLFWPEFYLIGYRGRLVVGAFLATMILLIAAKLWGGEE